MIRGLAPQPRLLWAVAIGAVLIALAIVSPVLGFFAVIFNAGLGIIPTANPAPSSPGAAEDVTGVAETPTAAGLMARIADHAPEELKAEPREVDGRFDRAGRLQLTYRTLSPKRGAYRFGPAGLRV